MIKKNITIKHIEKFNQASQLTIFLQQLKVFTPIEIKLIVETLQIPDTSVTDIK